MKSNDEWLEIKVTRDRINPYRNTPFEDVMKEVGSLNLRFVKVIHENDVEEYLLTNLSSEIFTHDDINFLYNLRWNIETAYDVLKNKLHMANFIGVKPRIIEQDIHLSIYLSNLINDIVNEAQEEIDSDENKKYKYEMKVNKNLAIGILKEDLLHILLTEDSKERKTLFERLYEDIRSNIIPIRKGRSYKRECKSPSYKHPITKKRSF